MELTRLLFIALLCTLLLSIVQAVPSVERQAAAEDVEADDTVEPSPSPDVDDGEEEVCVDAKYLSQYPSHMLVHKTAIRAAVLCPPSQFQLPCATRDHKLKVHGKSMSYQQFCDSDISTSNGSCERKRIAVNSVLSHLWKESSHHNNIIRLTMFDARHPESFQLAIHRITALRRSIVNYFA